MTRKLEYRWRLREVMAQRGLWATTDLAPLLVERGIELSPAQVYRLVAQRPERLSLATLAAICDALECTPNDLIEMTEADATPALPRRRAAAGAAAPPSSTSPVRPRRARIVPDQS
jgi:DNA-binding Xre family transcriptional regulator